MYGKIVNNVLIFAGDIIDTPEGQITNPTTGQLIENGYKVIIYNEKPTYDFEEEKLVETYTEERTIIVNYEKVALTDEEHNHVIQQEILEEENKMTPRRQREFDLKKEGAEEFVQTIENKIIALRKKFR